MGYCKLKVACYPGQLRERGEEREQEREREIDLDSSVRENVCAYASACVYTCTWKENGRYNFALKGLMETEQGLV